MKILIQLNQKRGEDYLLDLHQDMRAHHVWTLLDAGHRTAIQGLVAKSSKTIQVSPRYKKKVRHLANFVISSAGYTAERLA